MSHLVLKILTPEKIVFQERVDFVSLHGSSGSFGVLPGHAPLLSALKVAELELEIEGRRQRFAVNGGLCKVLDNHVTVLTDAAEPLGALGKG